MNKLYDDIYKKCGIGDIDDESKRLRCEAKLNMIIEQLIDLDKKSVAFLTEEQTFILRKKYGLLDNGISLNQSQIAYELGISRQAVSDYIGRSFDKLNKNIRLLGESDIESTIFPKEHFLESPIEILDLPYKIICALYREGVYHIGQLCKLNISDLYDIKDLGPKYARELIQKIHEYGVYFKDEEMLMEVEHEEDVKDKYQKILQLPLEVLGFSTRTYNALKSTGINCVCELVSLSNLQLLRKKNIGLYVCQEVRSVLEKYRLTLRNDEISNTTLKETNAKNSTHKDTYLMPIEELNLSLRVYNALKRAGINSVYDLTKFDAISLYGISRLGDKGVLEVKTKVEKLGLNFKAFSSIEDAVDEVKKRQKTSVSRYLSLEEEHENLSLEDEILTNQIKEMLRRNISKEEKHPFTASIKIKNK